MTLPQVIVFPDAEQLFSDGARTFLAANGRNVPVGTKVPNPRPPEFVRILRVGGIRANRIMDRPTLVAEYWAKTETAALTGLQLLRGWLLAVDVLAGVQVYHREELAGPANLPDPDSAHIRYTLTLSVLVRGAALG